MDDMSKPKRAPPRGKALSVLFTGEIKHEYYKGDGPMDAKAQIK
jgi:hypothetical protein